ncbi:DUF7577 domain-containing protein [Halosimplex sp. J119]
MASLLIALTLLVVAAVAVGLITWVAVFALGRAVAHSPRHEEVLPAHYSSLLYTAPSRYPGYCTNCGTSNDPEYSVCKNCSSKLPESGYDRSGGPPNAFLKE